MNQFHFKPLTLGLLTASVLTLAGLGLFASRTQAADAPKAAAAPKAALSCIFFVQIILQQLCTIRGLVIHRAPLRVALLREETSGKLQ